ncbi:MAG: VOC family protein [Pseudomonadota bacterium]
MGAIRKLGQIVWHDLMTGDVSAAKKFYADLFGWDYVIEHATDFVWTQGEADYPLIMAKGEAHGGFVDAGNSEQPRWLAFVTVDNVDDATKRAKGLKANIIREPFDIPGVGRCSVLEDPQGAQICPFVPSHDYPPPSGVFVQEHLLTPEVEASKQFYRDLFDWWNDGDEGGVSVSGHKVNSQISAAWTPLLGTQNTKAVAEKALSLGATRAHTEQQAIMLKDPTGAQFGLFEIS